MPSIASLSRWLCVHRDIETKEELEATREKLRQLEAYYETTRSNTSLHALAREDILRTTKRLVNQLTEEITWFEAHTSANSEG